MSILELDAFIRTVGINHDAHHSFFLGAGASISSGIPSAATLIWEWKRKIFLSNNLGLKEQFNELSLSSVRSRLQKWFDSKGDYPPNYSPEEYSFYIEKCYPLKDSRKIFFEEIIRGAFPYIGYKLLCLLAETDFFRSVWTTNFDGLVVKAAANFRLAPLEVGIDSQNRLPIQPQKGQLLCVSLHGDYRYDSLKNTTQELQEQEKVVRASMITHFKNYPIIVSGYSGRDKSIMETLREAYSQPGNSSFYWCGYGDEIPSTVQDLLDVAQKNGHQAFFVPTNGFDDLLQRLTLYCLQGENLIRARSLISESRFEPEKTPFKIEGDRIYGILKSNAFEISCPTDVYEVTMKIWPQSDVWAWLDEITKEGKVCAVPFKGKVLCVGLLEDIKILFQSQVIEQIQRVPISDKDLSFDDGIVISLLKKSLTLSMAKSRGLNTDGKGEMWGNNVQQVRKEGLYVCSVYSSIILFLRRIGGRLCLILKPSLHIIEENNLVIPRATINKIKNDILGYQHNKEFNIALEYWRALILPESEKFDKSLAVYVFPTQDNSNFLFKIRRAPLFASYKSVSNNINFNLSAKFLPLIKQRGILLSEPSLVFSNKQSTGHVKDNHPLRGLINNRPFDFPLTSQGLSPNIKIGVICPKRESVMLGAYLAKGQLSQKPTTSEQDYLITYPGFNSAFGLPLEMAQQGDTSWVDCLEVNQNLDDKNGAIELSRILISSINSLNASNKPNVILIFIPTRWKRFREFYSDDEIFDLHDYVKAYCVQKGIATQFLEEDTLSNSYQCRVWWWLSLAIYAKAMRTPWVIDNLDPDTAFVGLGFSTNHNLEKGKNVVLGCGHLYNSSGEGLQFRLSPIQNPIWIRRNPFMSLEDARNLGETIRQLFYETKMKLPRRVVIHKQTCFRKEEQDGLRAGLGGIDEVEMLEVNFDFALRYLSSVRKQDGSFDEDNYPVRRGTILQQDSFSFLLWVHGVTDSVQMGLKYFKGKRRIPTPIMVTRYAGNSDITTIGNEIIALSKMDWNSADMYSQLPATIQSSRQIARIGSLLQRFGPVSYDYRLFI
jgi:hypothetical protein